MWLIYALGGSVKMEVMSGCRNVPPAGYGKWLSHVQIQLVKVNNMCKTRYRKAYYNTITLFGVTKT